MQLRNSLLLLLSMMLIAAFNIESLVAIVFFSLITFFIARSVHASKFLFLAGIIINIAAIFFFNYFRLRNGHFEIAFRMSGFNVDKFIVAIGLSFYALQNISYLAEVHARRFPAVRNLPGYLLYNCYFPRVISGPVMFPEEFFPLLQKNNYSRERTMRGANRILLGLFKKLVIADNLAPSVASVFDYGSQYPGLTTFAGGFVFTVQLYFDFSGYSDIALGAADIAGIPLKENFNLPLRSGSVTEFWRRWHISLISWFTRYIYYPLVFRFRTSKRLAVIIGILVTFFVSGLWHGLAITFVVWSLIHAFSLCAELLLKFRIEKIGNRKFVRLLAVPYVLIIVSLSNIFFRLPGWDALKMQLGSAWRNFFPDEFMRDFIAPLAVGGHQLEQFNFFVIAFIAAGFLLFEKRIFSAVVSSRFRVLPVLIILLLIILFGVFSSSERFIYMQF